MYHNNIIPIMQSMCELKLTVTQMNLFKQYYRKHKNGKIIKLYSFNEQNYI